MRFVQQTLLYKQRVYTTLENMQKKVRQQCSATFVGKWCFKRRSSSKRKVLLEGGGWKYFQKRYPTSVWKDGILVKKIYINGTKIEKW